MNKLYSLGFLIYFSLILLLEITILNYVSNLINIPLINIILNIMQITIIFIFLSSQTFINKILKSYAFIICNLKKIYSKTSNKKLDNYINSFK